jgi:hypothetical protein
VLNTLGCIKGKRVLELGAGIGRFTGEIAKTAKSVTACDFMEVSIDENRWGPHPHDQPLAGGPGAGRGCTGRAARRGGPRRQHAPEAVGPIGARRGAGAVHSG